MSKKILIVEDDYDTATVIAEVLSQNGYQATTTRSRDEALTAMVLDEPEIILMDYWMSGLNALAFIDQVKRLYPSTRFALMTAEIHAREVGRMLGIESVLSKPFDDDQLIAVIESAK